jgi:hypothetical protein
MASWVWFCHDAGFRCLMFRGFTCNGSVGQALAATTMQPDSYWICWALEPTNTTCVCVLQRLEMLRMKSGCNVVAAEAWFHTCFVRVCVWGGGGGGALIGYRCLNNSSIKPCLLYKAIPQSVSKRLAGQPYADILVHFGHCGPGMATSVADVAACPSLPEC